MRAMATLAVGVLVLSACGSTSSDEDSDSDAADPTVTSSSPAARQTSESPAVTQKTKRPKNTQKPARPSPSRKPVKRYAVLSVVDGDTVHVAYRGDTSVRVIGIDTPETVSPSVPVECGGPAASAAAHRLLDGKSVQLVFDKSQGRTDKYGRTLAYLTVPGVGDYGLAMLRKGRAAEYTYDTAYMHQAQYQRAESRAKSADRGLWGNCGGPDKPLHKPRPTEAPAAPSGNCAPGYDPCVPPYPPDVNCDDVDGPIEVTGDDPHGLDRDGDGIACES